MPKAAKVLASIKRSKEKHSARNAAPSARERAGIDFERGMIKAKREFNDRTTSLLADFYRAVDKATEDYGWGEEQGFLNELYKATDQLERGKGLRRARDAGGRGHPAQPGHSICCQENAFLARKRACRGTLSYGVRLGYRRLGSDGCA